MAKVKKFNAKWQGRVGEVLLDNGLASDRFDRHDAHKVNHWLSRLSLLVNRASDARFFFGCQGVEGSCLDENVHFAKSLSRRPVVNGANLGVVQATQGQVLAQVFSLRGKKLKLDWCVFG